MPIMGHILTGRPTWATALPHFTPEHLPRLHVGSSFAPSALQQLTKTVLFPVLS